MKGGKSRYIILSITAVFISLLQGCNSAKQSILPNPAESVEQNATYSIFPELTEPGEKDAALIIARHNQPNTRVGIEQIDKERFNDADDQNRAEYKLAPGRHTIFYYFVRQRHASLISSADLNISFSAKPGHLYELKNYALWDDESPERVVTVDFLTMVIDTTEGEVVAWEGRGKGDFKKEIQNKNGLRLTDWSEKKAVKTDAVLSMGNESVFLDFVRRDNKYGLNKAVFLNFVHKGNKYGSYFIVNRIAHEKLASISRPVIYGKGKDKITKKDFILPRLNNQLQKEKLLPLVEKIRTLTPDVHEQARIAISLVQNIPYTDAADYEKYPYGVIYEHGGACSEKSDLLLFLLRELGFGTATLIYKNENHRAVGIKCPDEYDVGDTGYCYVEVTTPKIITDNMSGFEGAGTLSDFEVISISDGIQIEKIEEEFTDKNLYYALINKAKANKGLLEQNEYNLYNSILNKYGLE